MRTMCEPMTDNPNLVPPQDACPVCGERHIDSLVWIDDEWVRCASCGIQYDPQTGGRREPA
jgi:hypothetical protein